LTAIESFGISNRVRMFLKIFLTAAISLNLLGAVMPPRPCNMPCCQGSMGTGMAGGVMGVAQSCSGYLPLQMHAPEMPPCCKIQAAQDLGPATLNSLTASQPSINFAPVSGPGFAVNAFAVKAPFITGSPPGVLNSVPVYKLTSAYIC
jgi:hypothetical protein